jgi:hypothetical protein
MLSLESLKKSVKNITQGYNSTTPTVNRFNINSSSQSTTTTRIIAYILAIIVIILVILIFIHFCITPIFKLLPGGSGIIPVPGFDDGKLFWTNTTSGIILNKDLPIVSQFYGYTINLDVFIENPLQFSTSPRVFFSRGAVTKETPSGDTLLGILSNYNLVAALLPDTNDIIVSVLNKDNNMENIIVTNAPIQSPFRLSMVVMEQALEVYLNGKLVKTRSFTAPPKDVKGDINTTAGSNNNVIKLHNLKIWSRLLTVAEIRESAPKLSEAKDFGASPMAVSTTCSDTRSSNSSFGNITSSISNVASNAASNARTATTTAISSMNFGQT